MSIEAQKNQLVPENGAGRSLNIAGIILLFLFLAFFSYKIQYSFKGMVDGDAYVHTRMANHLYKEGPVRKFPWTQFSPWKERFHNKDFLFHVLLGPFCLDEENMVAGGKILTWLLGVLFFGSFALVLYLQRFRHAAIWMLLLTVSCRPIFFRLVRVRPQILSMIFIVFAIHAILKGKHKILCVLSFFFALAHTSAPIVVVLAALYILSGYILEGKIKLRPFLYAAAGLLAGFVINPFFPNNFYLWYLVGVRVLLSGLGMGGTIPPEFLGGEYVPVTTKQFLLFFRFLLPVLGIALLWAFRKIEAIDRRTLFLLFTAIFFTAFGFMSSRFLYEYWVFTAVLLCASIFGRVPWIESLLAVVKRRPLIAGGAACLILLYAGFFSATRGKKMLKNYENQLTCDIYEESVEYIKNHADSGEVVFHPTWEEFEALFHFNLENRYIVAFDPCYLFFHDEALFWTWANVQTGKSRNLYKDISKFGARWVFLEKYRRSNNRLIRRMSNDPRFDKRYEDPHAVVFFLLPEEKQ